MHQFNYHHVLWFPIHLLVIVGLFYTDYDLLHLFLAFIGWIFIPGLGSAVGFHRMLSHRSVEARPLIKKIITYLGVLCCQGSPIFWVALHRGYHHRFSDQEKDIHSPVHGKWVAYFGWTFRIKSDTINLKYAVDLLGDQFQLWIHKYYYQIIWGTWIIVTAIFGWEVTLWLILIPTIFGMHQDYLTNLLGHTPSVGYRNFDLKDNSTNVPWLAFLTWGQCWHNNHHKSPFSYDFGKEVSGKWWEWDPCRIFLPLFKKRNETH